MQLWERREAERGSRGEERRETGEKGEDEGKGREAEEGEQRREGGKRKEKRGETVTSRNLGLYSSRSKSPLSVILKA